MAGQQDPMALSVRDTSVDNTNQVVKVGSGRVYWFKLTNGGVVDAWFHFYDALTANVTVGTTVPKLSFCVPAGASATVTAQYEYDGIPIHFETGIIYAATTTPTGGTDPVVKPTLGGLLYR